LPPEPAEGADAFDLWRVQGIDLLAALFLALLAHAVRKRQHSREGGLLAIVALDLAHDVAPHAAQIGAQLAQFAVGALELLGVGVALMRDQRVFSDAFKRLTQDDALPLGQLHQLLARPVHQFGVGGEHHRLGLHRRIDDDPGEVRRLGRPRSRRHVQALLNQRRDLLFAHALAPAGDRRAVERQIMAKELFTAEQLIIGVLDPAFAQRLVRQVVGVLEDRQPRHQARGQRRLTRPIAIGLAEGLFQKRPIDVAAQRRQRVLHVDDLIQPGAKKIVLSGRTPLSGEHRITSPPRLERQ